MCGIAGFIDFSGNSDLSTLKKMSATQHHRGPDGEGFELLDTPQARIGFAHQRLSIIDLSALGNQPMKYKHFTIVFNGEMYNYQEVRKELEERRHQFISHSDTEVILHAFEEWGIQCIEKFIGMFGIVLHDAQKQEVYFIRDRAGVKPLFVYRKEDLLLFGSELKSLAAHPRFEKHINHDAVSLFLQYGYIPNPHCIFNHTEKIKPGYYIHFDLKSKAWTEYQYWNVYDAYNKPVNTIGWEEAVNETEKLLSSACNYRMVSDVPVGVFLSGGYDSSTVTALLQKDSTEKIKTFSIGFNDPKLNEAQYAKQVATHLGTDHTEYYCTEKEALEIVPGLPFYYDEPFADSSAIPTTLVSKLARQKVTVALSADAGDEVFAGYNRYDYLMTFGKKIKRIPAPLRKSMAGMMNRIDANSIPVLRNKYLFHSRYEKVKQFLKHSDDKSMNLVLSKQFLPEDASALLKHKPKTLLTAFESNELNPEFYSTLNYVMAVDYQTYLVDDILQKVDRATMTHSLEGREPLLDHRLIEWAASLPMDYKYHQGTKKYILREIAHRYLPKDLMERPKMGFGIPVAQWLSNELKPLVDDYFTTPFLEKQNIFEVHKTQQLIQAFYNGKKERAEKIWFLFMFQMWYKEWMIER